MKNEDTAFGFSLLPVECMLSGKRSLVLYALFDTSLNCIRHFHLARDTVLLESRIRGKRVTTFRLLVEAVENELK